MTKCRLSPVALGLALGSFGFLGVLIFGIATLLGVEVGFLHMMRNMHDGVEQTLAGFFVAALISFLVGFVRGFFIGWLYNLFAHCCCKGKGSAQCSE